MTAPVPGVAKSIGDAEQPAPEPVTKPTGDAEIDGALSGLISTEPGDLDAHITAGNALHDLLRRRLTDSEE